MISKNEKPSINDYKWSFQTKNIQGLELIARNSVQRENCDDSSGVCAKYEHNAIFLNFPNSVLNSDQQI